MSINTDLASWGEPPATLAEEALGAVLDEFWIELKQQNENEIQTLRPTSNAHRDRAQRLVEALSLLYFCAASLWENCNPENEKNSLDNSPVNTGANEDKNPMSTENEGHLPDPFPGEFQIRRLLGEGAFGKVWLADELKLGRQVALKTLKLPSTSTMGPQVLAALRNEAQHLAQLDHPNIVRVHAWRESAGDYYLVLQFVKGGSLASRLKTERALSWQEATRYVADVGEALIVAHQRGVIHRDIKPDNILWDPVRNEAMLTDFGVSAHLAEPGTVAGTPMYMAPEAFKGQISPILDVYSLAATLYRLVTGRLPFEKASMADLLDQKLRGLPVPDARCTTIPAALEQIIRAGLAGNPGDRPDMTEFVARLRGTLNQLLADTLALPVLHSDIKRSINVRLQLSRRIQGEIYQPIATTRPTPSGLSRDMRKVPPHPEQAILRTGDQLRIDVVADKPGYVTVFNIGPTGNLNLLYPGYPTAPQILIEQNKPLHVMDVEMTPPAGLERVFAVWTKDPLSFRLEQLLGFAESGGHDSRPYQASRDMKRVHQTVAALSHDECSTAVLELAHTAVS